MVDGGKIISTTQNNSGGADYILENGSKLGDVIGFLPNGIINKGVTGIGATTLEITCKRHSIIVQPLKVTAQAKAKKHNELIFFDASTTHKELHKQLQDSLNNQAFPFKKIILVIDNLSKLVRELGDEIYEYFILFDEIDFMQGSSTYRSAIEEGVDIAKKHKNFAFITATYLAHSDPELVDIPITSFRYDNAELIDLEVSYYSSQLDARLKYKATINKLYSYLCFAIPQSEVKFLVAVNSVKSIQKIADALVSNEIVSKNEISINISQGVADNVQVVEKFSGKFISDDKLPCRINFITSAYFNGYDIIEEKPYELLLCSSPIKEGLLLTPHEILQIHGRNRVKNGISKAILFMHDIKKSELPIEAFAEYAIEGWLDFAHTQLKAANCEYEHQAKYLSKMKNQGQALQKLFESSFEERRQQQYYFARKRNLNALDSELGKAPVKLKPDISYFKIDYWLHYYGSLASSAIGEEVIFVDSTNGEEEHELFSREIGYTHLTLIDYNLSAIKESHRYPIISIESEKKNFSESIEAALKQLRDNKFNDREIKFSGIASKLLQVYNSGILRYTHKSLMECFDNLKSAQELNILSNYIKIHSFKKHNIFLSALKECGLKGGVSYSTTELSKIIIEAFLLLNRPARRGQVLSQQMVKSILGPCFSFKQSSKAVKTRGAKNYILKAHNPFPGLVKRSGVIYTEEFIDI
jgi:hypothetical protein